MDEYDKIATKIEAEINEKDSKLIELTNNDKSFDVSRSYLLELASKARAIFESSKPEQRNKILKLLFSNLKIDQKRLNCNLLEPFNTLSTMSKSRNWPPGLGRDVAHHVHSFRTSLLVLESASRITIKTK